MTIPDGHSPVPPAEFYKAYEEYARNLRTWFVAYGIGAPVLLVTNGDVADKLSASHAAPCIAELFLFGVGLQIILAMVNKTAMWGCYWADRYPDEAEKWRFRLASWVSGQFWFDLVVDVATLMLFGAATWRAFRVLFAGG